MNTKLPEMKLTSIIPALNKEGAIKRIRDIKHSYGIDHLCSTPEDAGSRDGRLLITGAVRELMHTFDIKESEI